MSHVSRRMFLETAAGATLAAGLGTLSEPCFAQEKPAAIREKKGGDIRYGLVTYQWAKDWDLPTLIANCAKAKVLGVELRTTHKHGVEPNLSMQERSDVRKRFADSPVKFLGIGSNERYDSPDPTVVAKAIEATKQFIELSHDVGGSGVKVKPDSFHKDVPREKTIEQIGMAKFWHEEMLLPGDDRDPKIAAELAAADLILMLVTADYLSDDPLLEKQFNPAMARISDGKTKVVPVILKPSPWKMIPGLTQLPVILPNPGSEPGKAITTWPNQDEALQNIVEHLKNLLK